MSGRSRTRPSYTVDEVCAALEAMAPLGLAESWDNVGLLAGDLTARVRQVLLCIDLTPAVVNEAIQTNTDFILSYHPPIFKPISALRVPSGGTDAVVFRCIRQGIAVYSPHTALDAAEGGTNDVLAALCGVKETEPLEYVDEPGKNEVKLVVFVPPDEVEKVAGAMFAAGAGHIGDYRRCSFRIPGQGTFFGSETTQPTIGQRGRIEYVDEIRLESIVPAAALPAVVHAMIKAHSYEEPAFDIYPLQAKPTRGPGRVGRLPRPTTLRQLARRLKRTTLAPSVQLVGPPDRRVARAIVAVGAAGPLPFRIPVTASDVIVTGEIRHHDALTIRRHDCTAIALGHWSSERPVLPTLAERLAAELPGLTLAVSDADHEPFHPV